MHGSGVAIFQIYTLKPLAVIDYIYNATRQPTVHSSAKANTVNQDIDASKSQTKTLQNENAMGIFHSF